MPEQKKLIQFKNIVKSFEDGQVVLKGVSLDIYENEFVTLLGPSGCGKRRCCVSSADFYSRPRARSSSTARTS